jgi:hypothetical protein
LGKSRVGRQREVARQARGCTVKRCDVDDVLVEWGARLFLGFKNYSVRATGGDVIPTPSSSRHAHLVRTQIAALTRPKARQVMVKITGGGRGMKAIAAHLSYISKHGRLPIETERGERVEGKEALRDLQDEWRLGRTILQDRSHRREAHHVMFSMPAGTSPQAILDSVRAVAAEHLSNHAYAMVLHEHQANPHVHLAVKAEGIDGRRLNPRKADLRSWRAAFARELQDRGIEAVATSQPTHGASRNHPERWRVAARAEGREQITRPSLRRSEAAARSRLHAFEAWGKVFDALSRSVDAADRRLAASVAVWLGRSKSVLETRQKVLPNGSTVERRRPGKELDR